MCRYFISLRLILDSFIALVLAPVPTVPVRCEFNVVKRWLYGLSENIIFWCSEGRSQAPSEKHADCVNRLQEVIRIGVFRLASHGKPSCVMGSWAWLAKF